MTTALLHPDPEDFSLVLGGPLFQLFRRAHLSGTGLELLRRRAIVITLFAWLPLAVLCLLQRPLGGVKLTFLNDIEAHARFLVALPMLVVAELIVHRRIGGVLRQFIDRDLIRPEQRARFDAAIESATRLRNSVPIEIALILIVYTVGQWLWWSRLALQQTTWYATPTGAGLRLSTAGCWYVFLSLPLFQFILLRWYFRIFIWFWLLFRISRLDLNLVPTHPDKAGGLGFIGVSAYAFAPLLFAQGAVLSGLIANRIFHEGRKLPSFRVEIVGLVLFIEFFILSPLLVFTPQLLTAQRKGRREYGILAMRYVREFDAKWLRGGAPPGEALLGSGDIQSLADLGNSYAAVRDMRILPFGMDIIALLALVTAAPILPLVLTVIPLDAIVDRLLHSFI